MNIRKNENLPNYLNYNDFVILDSSLKYYLNKYNLLIKNNIIKKDDIKDCKKMLYTELHKRNQINKYDKNIYNNITLSTTLSLIFNFGISVSFIKLLVMFDKISKLKAKIFSINITIILNICSLNYYIKENNNFQEYIVNKYTFIDYIKSNHNHNYNNNNNNFNLYNKNF